MERRKHATIADVAREARVHPSTVSRVFNGHAKVRPSTRARIDAAIASLQYRPNVSARSLASARTWTLGVLLPDMANLMHAEFLRGVQEVAQGLGYSVIVCDGRLDPDVQAAELDRFRALRVDGVIVTRAFALPELLRPLIDAGIPAEPRELLDHAEADDLLLRRRGSVSAFCRLFELGHRDVAMFVLEREDAPSRSFEMRSRISALRRARVECGAVGGATHVVPIQSADECGRELASLMAGDHPPTVLVAGNDWMTAPLLGAARDAGLMIPEDVSFLAYGDSRWAAAYRPPISVIRYDYHGEGRVLAARVLSRIGEPVDPDQTNQPLAADEFMDRGSLTVPHE